MGDIERWLSYLSFVVGGFLLAWSFTQTSATIGGTLLLASFVSILIGLFFLRKTRSEEEMNL